MLCWYGITWTMATCPRPCACALQQADGGSLSCESQRLWRASVYMRKARAPPRWPEAALLTKVCLEAASHARPSYKGPTRPTSGLRMVTPASDMPSSRQVEFNDDPRITKSVSGLSDCRKPAWSMLLPTCDGRPWQPGVR